MGSWWLWYALGRLLVGTGPLIAVIRHEKAHGDPAPNSVAFGMCARFTRRPSIGMILTGLINGFLTWGAEHDPPRS